MKRTLVCAVAVAMLLSAGSSYAFQHGNGGGPKGKTSGPAVKAGGAPKTHGQGAPKAPTGSKAMGGPKAQGGPKVKSASAGPKAHTPGSMASAGAVKTTKKTTSTTTSTTTSGTTTGGTTLTLTPVQQKLQKNTNLASKLEVRLKGADLMTSAEGFRNLGQFVAAVNVSNNLGIPFADLKTRMVTDGMSLGQAIKSERPSANVTTEVQRAETAANQLIASTTTTTTTTSPTTTTATKGKKSKTQK